MTYYIISLTVFGFARLLRFTGGLHGGGGGEGERRICLGR